MIRLTKLSDYGLILLTYFARRADRPMLSALELAAQTQLPLPTVGKLLKLLAREGLLNSQRGPRGGYSLANLPAEISVAQIITALEGPIAITECGSSKTPDPSCEYQAQCPTRGHWQLINRAIQKALANVSLRELAYPIASDVPAVSEGRAAIDRSNSYQLPKSFRESI